MLIAASGMLTHTTKQRRNFLMQCCPQCNSKAFKRNGYTRHGKQNHRCLDCGRQFSLELFHFSTEDTQPDASENLLVQSSAVESSFS